MNPKARASKRHLLFDVLCDFISDERQNGWRTGTSPPFAESLCCYLDDLSLGEDNRSSIDWLEQDELEILNEFSQALEEYLNSHSSVSPPNKTDADWMHVVATARNTWFALIDKVHAKESVLMNNLAASSE